MSVLNVTPAARDQVKDVGRYTRSRWGKEQARNYLREIDRVMKMVADNPLLGRECPEAGTGYRSIPVNRHVIYYKPEDGGVSVIGVLHERMDVKRWL